MRENKYGLRLKESDSILKYKVINLTGNGQTLQIFELTDQGEQDWVLPNVEDVKQALKERASWYVSSYQSPLINYPKHQLEIVQIDKYEKVEKYNEYTDRDKLNEYHQNRVELAMKVLSLEEEKKKAEQLMDAEIAEAASPLQQEPMFAKFATAKAPKIQEKIQELVPHQLNQKEPTEGTSKEPNTPTAPSVDEAPKQLVKGISKIKVHCLKNIPKEWGSLDSDSASNCFVQGKYYLGYTKKGKFYVINEDKVPEFICNDSEDKKWEDNFFFRSHFDITEYIK